jgi:hypothetical protein
MVGLLGLCGLGYLSNLIVALDGLDEMLRHACLRS